MTSLKNSAGNEISLIGDQALNLPPIINGYESTQIQIKTENFYRSVANLFEVWILRSASSNTQRSYRASVMSFIEYQGINWPDNSWALLQSTVEQVREWRAFMLFEKRAPNTINHRISSLSGFFTFLREVSAEQRLPIQVPNPAHKDFIKREVALPVNETQALSLSDARRLLQLPRLDTEIGKRDQAIIAFYLYTGARIGTGCRLEVHDFIDAPDDPKIKIQEKGKGASKRTIGFNQIAADILNAYLIGVGITSGKVFKKQLNPNSKRLDNAGLAEQAMYRIIKKYLVLLPNAMQEIQLPDDSLVSVCRYSPHSLRATTATLLLDAGVPMQAVQKLLGHAHITTTQSYNKQRMQSKDSASHLMPF